MMATAARSSRLSEVSPSPGGDFVPADTLLFKEQVGVSVSGHEAVLRALTNQDPDAARAAMADHIEATRAHIHRVLRGDRLQRP